MSAASGTLLVGIAGLVAVVIGFPITLALARRGVERTGRVERRPLVIALLLGVVAVASIALVVGAVVLI